MHIIALVPTTKTIKVSRKFVKGFADFFTLFEGEGVGGESVKTRSFIVYYSYQKHPKKGKCIK